MKEWDWDLTKWVWWQWCIFIGFIIAYFAFNVTGTVFLSRFPDRDITGADYGGSITACVLGWLGYPILNIVPPIIYGQHESVFKTPVP